ncbi:NAD(P)-dependent oxidoreductase [Streptomyces sp. ISL-43]|uniref:NAD-dependent epimerase/dehydratase family protein n=1 Tax=Streptomyces sp. ISL-43 TaxID=2819183 RepID=UPI001BEC118C|nr:NAD(P)-dependent oxidoreductase [Streptomyces sp. ISL-43]MBT2450775.1 NAD(P)-dependent oxidoreductase [Streptomyces sp. ISL-43]
MTQPRTLLLTGAAGGVAAFLRESLPGYGYRLRLADLKPVEGAESLVFDLRDAEAVRAAVRGVDAVVHLGGISLEDTFEAVLEANIRGTYHLYEAVRQEGIRRVVFAGSNHAVGYVPLAGGEPIGSGIPARPDTYYGLSKAFGENLASLYADKYGVETVSIRIGSCFAEPRTVRMLSTWLSPADCARLVHAALTAPGVGHTVVNGISANTRAWWDLGAARALGYVPQDDAEPYAEALLAAHGPLDHHHPDARFVGGSFTRTDPHRSE